MIRQSGTNYLDAGHAEKANELGESPQGPISHMPHRGVVRPGSETTKLRVVFDASSKAAGKLSLNDVLYAGPNLNPSLSDILIRFRVHNVAIMSDIEKAFLQIELAEKERDALRFLWYQSTPKQGEILPPIKEYRMTRVLFGATCSPFLLVATLRHHLKGVEENFPRTAKILSDNLYVYDFVTGADSVEEAEQICKEAQAILNMGGMNLRKWRSNNQDVMASLTEIETAQTAIPELAPTKILGVEWRPATDEFVFEMSALIAFLASRQDTKRFLLQASARIFEPFGFLAPTTITAKMFQRLWVRGTAWDEIIPPDVQERWDKWCRQLPQLQKITIPRTLARDLKRADTKPELHIFSDASPMAYGAVAYIKARNKEGEVTVVLLMAKARVAPLKRLSLARLELMGALIGARLVSYLTKQLNIEDISVHCWTDSTVALSWIKSCAQRWKPFVSNRVQEIQTLTETASMDKDG